MLYLDEKGDHLPRKEECTAGVGGARNEKEEYQIYPAAHGWVWKSTHTSWGAQKGGGSGVRNDIEECESRHRSTNGD